LKYLFSSTNKEHITNELVFILVPHIVRSQELNDLNRRAFDVGTGSGCIAIALKNKLRDIEMWACDLNDDALNVARLNADVLHATIDFVALNFLDPNQRRQLPSVDVIVSMYSLLE